MKIGLLVPSSNTTVEPEFYKVAPPGTTIHTMRMPIRNNTVEELRAMEKNMEGAVSMLADAEVNVICYACTSGSLHGGLKHEEEIAARMRKASGTKSITTAGSVVKALRSLRLKRISVGTPYLDEVNVKVASFLRENEFEVVKMKGLGILKNVDVGAQDPSVAYELGKEVNVQQSDGVFISCTNFRTVEITDRLEKEINKPVVTSNIASIWNCLRTMGSKEAIKDYGSLFQRV